MLTLPSGFSKTLHRAILLTPYRYNDYSHVGVTFDIRYADDFHPDCARSFSGGLFLDAKLRITASVVYDLTDNDIIRVSKGRRPVDREIADCVISDRRNIDIGINRPRPDAAGFKPTFNDKIFIESVGGRGSWSCGTQRKARTARYIRPQWIRRRALSLEKLPRGAGRKRGQDPPPTKK